MTLMSCHYMLQCGTRLMLGTIVTFPKPSGWGRGGGGFGVPDWEPPRIPQGPKAEPWQSFPCNFPSVYNLCRPGQGYMELVHRFIIKHGHCGMAWEGLSSSQKYP